MKQAILILIVWQTAITVYAQTIRDYFIPESPNNKVSFYSLSSAGERINEMEMSRTIYYVKKDITYEITDAKMINGTPASITTITVQFSPTDVKMTKSVLTNAMGTTNKKQSYNPASVLLKMPISEKPIYWSSIEIAGDTCKYTASWTNVAFNGEQRKAIKVSKSYKGEALKEITYYVRGIGLWKTDVQTSDGENHAFEKFDGLDYDPTAK